MITEADARNLINDIFKEEALVIGGLVAIHEVDDDLVWDLIKNIDVIRGRFLRRIADVASPGEADPSSNGPKLKPHPAIEDFLLSLRRA